MLWSDKIDEGIVWCETTAGSGANRWSPIAGCGGAEFRAVRGVTCCSPAAHMRWADPLLLRAYFGRGGPVATGCRSLEWTITCWAECGLVRSRRWYHRASAPGSRLGPLPSLSPLLAQAERGGVGLAGAGCDLLQHLLAARMFNALTALCDHHIARLRTCPRHPMFGPHWEHGRACVGGDVFSATACAIGFGLVAWAVARPLRDWMPLLWELRTSCRRALGIPVARVQLLG